MKRIYQFLFVLAISVVMSLQANACGLEKKEVSHNLCSKSHVETVHKTAVNDNRYSSKSASSSQCYPCKGTGRVTCGGCNGKGYNPYSKNRSTCTICRGSGTTRCYVCGGTGRR